MEVSRKTATKLFEALGYGTAVNWTGEKLYKKINNLPNIVEENFDLKSDELNTLVHNILHSTEAVNIVETEVEEQQEETKENEDTMKAKIKKSQKEPKAPKEPKVKKEKKQTEVVELDIFGNRKGTTLAKVNAALSKSPKTMKQIQEELGIKTTFYDHLKKLVEKGFVVKTDKTFHLK